MKKILNKDAGSFRDPANSVYQLIDDTGKIRIIRGLREDALKNYKELITQEFYLDLSSEGSLVETREISNKDFDKPSEGKWSGYIEHEQIPFISYPYEWPFSMLKDAALLHLELMEKSLESGWTLKDATPYNIQWKNLKPIFIDIPSFEPWIKGEPWVGYRQFCSMFLAPLLLKSHLNIDYVDILRSSLDGISPTESIKLFQGLNKFKKGVISHIYFPSKVENSILNRERDDAYAKKRKAPSHSKAMIIGLVQSLRRLINRLNYKIGHSDWSQYDITHSYDDSDFNSKKKFIEKHASSRFREQIWDIGCNTGTFSDICSQHCDQVISIDSDFVAIEKLFLSQKEKTSSNILPIVMNLANTSPSQGFASKERKSFEERGNPELIICLALIHHMRISSNIPNIEFLKYLRSFDAEIIIEFVDRHDEMVKKLLTNKKEDYPDYNKQDFLREVQKYFEIKDRQSLKNDNREIFFLTPK